MKTKDKDLIKNAICYLDSVCDGAEAKDNRGFNAFDAPMGNVIANQIRAGNVTDKQLVAGYKMLGKYAQQLSAAGYTLPTNIKIKSNQNGKSKPKIDFDGTSVLIYFGGKPSKENRALLDELPYRRWDPNRTGLPWITHAIYATKVKKIFGERSDWIYTDSFIQAVKNTPQRPSETPFCPKIDIADSQILFYFGGPPSKENRALIDTLEQRKWNPNLPGKPWSSPARLIETIFDLFQERAELTQEFKTELQKRRQLANMSRSAESIFEVPGLSGTLFPYQAAGVEFIETANGRALLADEMGLGKTIQAIAYMQLHPDFRPVIIVCPASLKINWSREIEKWLSDNKRVAILAGRTPEESQYKNADVLIINYAIVSHWVDELVKLKPEIVIVDEAHKCKNMKALRTKAVKKLAQASKAFVPMTGTPIRNKPVELFTQLNMVAPGDWSSWYHVATKYNGFVRGYGLGDAQNLDELHQIIKPYVIRRTKKEVLKELPEKIRTTVVLEFSERERRSYNKHIAEIAMETDNHLAIIEAAKQAAAIGKLPAVLDWIGEFLESGEKLVVFANHRNIVEQIYAKFKEQAVMMYGGMTQSKRQNSVDEFQNNPNVKLFVGNMDAAGIGITLTAASNVGIVEYPWTPDTLDQAIDRCHRIGQLNSVTAWQFVAENTIEERIVDLLETKSKIIHDTMDNGHVDHDFSILGELIEIIKTQTANIKETVPNKI